MIAAVAGGVPVKGARLLPTMRFPPGVRTPQKQVHHDNLPPSKAVVPPLGRPHQHRAALAPAQCYSLVHHSPAVHCASAPLLPAKATEGAGALLLLRPQCCIVAAAVVPLRNAIRQSIIHRRSIAASAPLLLAKATEGAGNCCCCGHSTVPSPPL